MSANKLPLVRLYKKIMKNGQEFWTGTFGASNVVMFVNGYKQSDKDPEYVVYLTEKPKQQQYPNKGYVQQPQQDPPLDFYPRGVSTQTLPPQQTQQTKPGSKFQQFQNSIQKGQTKPVPNLAIPKQDPEQAAYFESDPGPEEEVPF